jgi:hypothetical protein
MEIAESAGSQIDTSGEANDFANAALSDLKEPGVDFEVAMDYFWPVQVSDYYRFTDNAVHHDTNQDLGVVSFTHTVAGHRGETTLAVRGKPSAGVKRWLAIEGRSGNAPMADFTAPEQVTATLSPEKGGIVIQYTKPTEPDWDFTECHVFGPTTASDFTAGPSTLAAKAKTDRFEILGLTPGERYLVKLIAVDLKGNTATISSAAAIATLFVSPIHINPSTEKVNSIFNGEFEIWTPPLVKTDDPPDIWDAGYWTSVWNSDPDAWGDPPAGQQVVGIPSLPTLTRHFKLMA